MDDQSYNNRFYLKYSVDIGIDITTILYRILYLLIIECENDYVNLCK